MNHHLTFEQAVCAGTRALTCTDMRLSIRPNINTQTKEVLETQPLTQTHTAASFLLVSIFHTQPKVYTVIHIYKISIYHTRLEERKSIYIICELLASGSVQICVCLAKRTPDLRNAPLLAAFESRYFYFD